MSSIEQRIQKLSPAQQRLVRQKLQEQKRNLPETKRPPSGAPAVIPRRDNSAPAPLSFGQMRFWFFQQLAPDQSGYSRIENWHLSGPLNRDALQRALVEIARRHESIRTKFPQQNGEPIQVIVPAEELPFSVINLLDITKAGQALAIEKRLTEQTQRPFDLARELPWRFTLIQLGPTEHLLLRTTHHIATDGWSWNILKYELSQIYSAFVQNQPSPLPENTIQYADFAIWQRQQLTGSKLEQQQAYWRKQLADLPLLQLPLDFPRPSLQTFNGARYRFDFPAQLVDGLKTLSKANGATLFMVLLAAFQVFLYRYSNQTDIAVGSPIAGRNRRELESLIGFFVNTLVLRMQLDPRQSFKELLNLVKKTTLDAYAHQEAPFEKIVADLQPDRNLSHPPLCQAILVFQSGSRTQIELTDLDVEILPPSVETTALDLTLNILDQPEGMQGHFIYNTDLFNESTIVRMVAHFQTLLQGILLNPAALIADLPLLTKVERHQLLVEWNDTALDFGEPQTIHTLFEQQTTVGVPTYLIDEEKIQTTVDFGELNTIHALFQTQVAKRPQATAFLYDDTVLTYKELNTRANQLANYLQSLGLEKGDIFGVCLTRSFDAVISLLAIMKIGGVYLPLDPGCPNERMAFMLADAQASFVITTESLRTNLVNNTGQFIYLDKIEESLAIRSTKNVKVPIEPDDIAYIIYTSGSTGQPKGTLVPHRQILNRLHWMWGAYPFATDEMNCHKTALTFVDSLWELLGPLLQGSPTVILDDNVVRDPLQLFRALDRHAVTRLWVVPTLLQMMLSTNSDSRNCLTHLKFVVTGGEPLPTSLYRQFQQQMPRSTLYNIYGTSEVWDATCYEPTEEHLHLPTVPIGKPINNVETYILDEQLQPVPVGVEGELFVAGAGLAQGYLNQPELTTEKFIPHPFNSSERLYRSGDMARYLPDGNIEFLGRKDSQVKIRGFRIELGEIENALSSHPKVQKAIVLARDREHGDKQLVAYVVGSGVTEELRTDLARKLPNYMLPAFYVQLDSLPLMTNGKIDRHALPEPDLGKLISVDSFIAPRSTIEKQLADIWIELLNIERVGIHDNFFELGGHSLKATQVISRIRDTFQIELPLRSLFEEPTIGNVGAQIDTILSFMKSDLIAGETTPFAEEGEI